MKIHNNPQQNVNQLPESKEKRLDQVQEALDERSVRLASLDPSQRAANRSYGAKVLGDMEQVKSAVPTDSSASQKASDSESEKSLSGETQTMSKLFGYGAGGFPGMDGLSAMMMMLMIEQHMIMLMMMMLMMQGGTVPPNWQQGWNGGHNPEPGVDQIPGGNESENKPIDPNRPSPEGENSSPSGQDKQMTPVRATRILKQYFDLVDTAAGIGEKDGIVGKKDLEAVSGNPDAPKDLKDAVAYILRNPMILNAIDVAAGQGRVDGKIGKKDVDKFIADHKGKEGYDTVAESDKKVVPPKPSPGVLPPNANPNPSEKSDGREVVEVDGQDETAVKPATPKTPEANAADLRAQQEATRIHKAVSGMGTDEATLTRLLGGRNNEDIQRIKDAYEKSYGKKLSQVVRSETSGHLQTLLLALLEGRATEETPVDTFLVGKDVDSIHKAINRWGTDEKTLISIFASRSKKHLAEVSKAYKEAHGVALSDAIKGDTSGILETGLLQNL